MTASTAKEISDMKGLIWLWRHRNCWQELKELWEDNPIESPDLLHRIMYKQNVCERGTGRVKMAGRKYTDLEALNKRMLDL